MPSFHKSTKLCVCFLLLTCSLNNALGDEDHSLDQVNTGKESNQLKTLSVRKGSSANTNISQLYFNRSNRRHRSYNTRVDDEDTFGSGSGDGEWKTDTEKGLGKTEDEESSISKTRKVINLVEAALPGLIHETDGEDNKSKVNKDKIPHHKYSNSEMEPPEERPSPDEDLILLSTEKEVDSISTITEHPQIHTSAISTSTATQITTITPAPSTTITATAPASTMIAPTTKTPELQCLDKQCSNSSVKIEPEFQSLLPGQNITLLCKTQNSNESTFYAWNWIYEENSSLHIFNESQLIIQDASLEQSGIYECVTSDPDGCCKDSASAKVVVYLKPDYLKDILIMLGLFASLLIVCLLSTFFVRRRYTKLVKKGEDDDAERLPL